MNSFTRNIVFALVVSVAICSASPARLERVRTSKSKFSARQEVAQDAPTPTPYPAAGFRPELRFTLPTDEKLIVPDNTYLPPVGEPAKTYGPPAKTYGPPEVSVKDEVEDVPSENPVESEEEKPEEPDSEDTQSESVESNEIPEGVKSIAVSGDNPTAQSDEEPQSEDVSEKDAEAEQIEEIIKEIEAEEDLIDSIPERIVLAMRNSRRETKPIASKLQLASSQKRQSLVARPIYLISRNGQLYKLLK